jgi:hypothetical protein
MEVGKDINTNGLAVSDPAQALVLKSPWRNAYWFARMLIANDQYGAVGKNTKLLNELTISLKAILEDPSTENTAKLILSKNVLRVLVIKSFSKAKSKLPRVERFVVDVSEKFQTTDDISVFLLTMENIIVPINRAMLGIPSDDKEFTVTLANEYLNELGEGALATVVRLWDDAGVEGCLNAERAAVVREFSHLRNDISHLPTHLSDIVLTAFVQEFERRLGQKRKSRAGGSLEDVATFLFNYYSIKADNAPEHFQADIEVDKWVKCKDRWLIAISCKRTLRERWKQVSSASSGVMSKFKIRQIWHLVTYDEDLSDDKLAALGEQRHVFYLRDDSRKLVEYSSKIGLKDYVRPMSNFIKDLKSEVEK